MAPLSAANLALACAKDSELFARTWFPKTMRQKSAPGHGEIWRALEDPSARMVNLEASRGFAKTTLARIYTAKRVAYATAHTMLYVGASDDHARRSIMWLRSRIAQKDIATGGLVPTKFGSFYGLSAGAKWNENELEITHRLDQRPIWILGVGITGNIRGINFDDYRPDFIYCDDILTDENTATKEQREKIFDLVFGALKESLAPRVDEPNSKMVIGQTPHDPDDVCARAKASKEFTTVSIPCWTKETMDERVERQKSAWEERFPTVELRAEKEDAIANNRYSIFAREKECRLVTRETAAFRAEWAKFYVGRARRDGYTVLAIDPVPPPSDREISKRFLGKDWECQMVVTRVGGDYQVLEYEMNRGHEPDWSVNTALNLAREYRVSRIGIESVAYQRTLKWLLEKEMQRKQLYFVVDAIIDTRKKFARITSALGGLLREGRLAVRADMVELLKQLQAYPNVEHDDVLDALSIALTMLVNPFLEMEDLGEGLVSGEKFEPMFTCP
jgi:phage terminase large subunit-like protein